MKILIAEADPLTRIAIEEPLRLADFLSESTGSAEEAITFAKDYPFDLITLDTEFADLPGFRALQAVRAGVTTPIIVLSSRSSIAAIVEGLNRGADDYMTKPFHRDELIARILAVMRRSQGFARNLLSFGDLTLDIDNRTATLAGRHFHCAPSEWRMLELMALRQGRVITKEMFLDHLYGGRDEPVLKIIDVFIYRLRRRLFEASGGRDYIETVWGRGYMLRDPDICKPPIRRSCRYREAFAV